MPSRERVRELVRTGMGYEEVADRLGISPGLAYLLATGLPADGSDAPTARAHRRPGFLRSSQHLASPAPAETPGASARVHAWVRARALGDRAMQQAAARRAAEEQQEEGS